MVAFGPVEINKRIISWMDQTLYPHTRPRWDDQLFRERILELVDEKHTVLDIGAGAGIIAQTDYRGMVGRICGIDPDERVRENPHLDEGKVAFAEDIPYPDDTFDLAFSSNVLEHLADPEAVFREIGRVLKPGGMFVAKTPNLFHYMSITARVTPHWFHELVIGKIFTRKSDDTFPTLYRANTRRMVRKHASRAGLEVDSIDLHEDRPEYLRFSFPTYFAGWAYEKIVNNTPGFDRFRIVMIVTLRKPLKQS